MQIGVILRQIHKVPTLQQDRMAGRYLGRYYRDNGLSQLFYKFKNLVSSTELVVTVVDIISHTTRQLRVHVDRTRPHSMMFRGTPKTKKYTSH